MDLSQVEMIPAVIVDIGDPKACNRVRVACPGIFDPDAMDLAALPWIYPLTMPNFNSFSTPKLGAKVWLINNKENKMEYWYIPFFEVSTDSSTSAVDATAPESTTTNNHETLFERSSGAFTATQFYNDDQGHVMSIDKSKINITPDNNVTITGGAGGTTAMLVKDSLVKVGDSGTDYEAGVLGDQLESLLSTLSKDLQSLAASISANPYICGLATDITTMVQNLNTNIQTIKAKNTYLN